MGSDWENLAAMNKPQGGESFKERVGSLKEKAYAKRVWESPIYPISKPESPIEHLDGNTMRAIEYFDKQGGHQDTKRKNDHPAANGNVQAVNTQTQIIGSNKAPIMQSYGNIRFRVLRNIRYIDRNGKKSQDYEDRLLIDVISSYSIPGRSLGVIEIRYGEIPRLVKIAQAKIPSVIITRDALKEHLPEEDVRLQINEVPIETVYVDAGWQTINGRHYYLFKSTDSGINVCCSRNLPFYANWGAQELFNTWNELLSLYQEPGVGIVLALFVFTGVTYQLFDDANYAFDSVLFMTGRTGSMKSSIARVLAFQLMDDDARQQPRRIDQDTEASLEAALIHSGRDTTTLFDDYCPARTARAKNRMSDNFERIVRMVGDRATKGRSNSSLEDCRGAGVHGSVVITGEVYGEGESSNLRCLYVPIVKELVNVKALSWLQENEFAVTTLVKNFADHIALNWEGLVIYIRHYFPMFRSEAIRAGKFKHNRSAHRYAYFCLLAKLVKHFLEVRCGVGDSYLENCFGEQLDRNLVRVLSDSEEGAELSNPVNNFLTAMLSLMARGELKVKRCKLEAADLDIFDGYEDGSAYYFQDCRLYSKVTTWLAATKTPFYLCLSEIKKMLADEGYIVTHGNGQGKRTLCVRTRIPGCDYKVDFLKFRKSRLMERCEDERQDYGRDF